MGSISSKVKASHLSKDKKNAIVKHSEQKIKQIKQDLSQFQQTIMHKTNNGGTKEEIKRMLFVTEKAKTQVEREDKPFTKNDWIAILVAVGEIELKDMETAEKLYTVPVLMTKIRCSVYDVNRYVPIKTDGSKPIINSYCVNNNRITNEEKKNIYM